MAKDSNLWEQAYESYKKHKPYSQFNKKKQVKRVKPTLEKEPMLLLQEYREILAEIKRLTIRRQYIRKQLQANGTDPVNYTRSDYFERPILLYILKLQNDCWYIGMSRNVDRRYKAHQKGKTLWTKEHPPMLIHEVIETGIANDSEANKMEDELTIEYARRYGTDKVRGGGYCQRKPKWPAIAYEPDMSWVK